MTSPYLKLEPHRPFRSSACCCHSFIQVLIACVQELATGRTSVFVAHRLSTVQRCDKIIVMSGGVIAEQGTHEELMAARRIYYDMWEVQKAADAEAEKVVCSSFGSYDSSVDEGEHHNGRSPAKQLMVNQA